MDKARLQAFVDGELSPEAAAEVVLHLADHAEDQAYVDDLVSASVALLRAFGGPIHEPVPETILKTIFPPVSSAEVASLAWIKRGRNWRIATAMGGVVALAAAFALVAFLPGTGTSADPARLAVGGVDPETPLYDLMQTAPTGEVRDLAPGAQAVVLATLPTATGYCREVEVVNRQEDTVQLGLACGRAGSWEMDVVFAEGIPEAIEEEGFLPASGEEAGHMGTWLDRRGAGAVLAPDLEREAISEAWR